MSMSGWQMMRSLTRDSSVAQRKLAPGTARRVVGYASPYRRQIIAFLVLVVIDAALVVAPPLLLGQIIDRGVTPGDSGVVVRLSLLVAALAVLDGVMTLVQRWYSSRIGEGLIFDLRTAGVRPRPAPADRLLHPGADRRPGQPAQQRRHRRPAGVHVHAVRCGEQQSSASW